NDYEIPGSHALEYVLYISNEQQLTERIRLDYGLRFTLFQNIGKSTVYSFDENHEKRDSTVYSSGEIFNSNAAIEPRVSMHIETGRHSGISASYSRTTQNLHLISNSSAGTPIDIWIPSSPNIKSQKADQYSIGYLRKSRDNFYEVSLEVYYKKMFNQIDYKDHADIILNPELEGELRSGWGRSYGVESMLQKT
ncbi:MAG: TonB-dependent receptor, partial [Bacteroidales bacterium]